MRFLFDTNIIIYYFNGLTADEALHDLLRERFNISIISKIEFLSSRAFRFVLRSPSPEGA